jgi:hypothetical protein
VEDVEGTRVDAIEHLLCRRVFPSTDCALTLSVVYALTLSVVYDDKEHSFPLLLVYRLSPDAHHGILFNPSTLG